MSVRLALVILLVAPSAFGAEAQLSDFSGTVKITRGEKKVTIKKGLRLKNGDTVKTGKKGWAIIDLGAGSVVKLKALTSMTLEGLASKKKKNSFTSVFLDFGEMFAKTKRGGRFQTRTKAVTAAVRGTQFFIGYGRPVKKGRDLWLCVNEGTVDVKNNEDGSTTPVKEGMGIIIEPGKKILPPKEYAWTKDLNWNMDPAEGSVLDTTSLDDAYGDPLDVDYE